MEWSLISLFLQEMEVTFIKCHSQVLQILNKCRWKLVWVDQDVLRDGLKKLATSIPESRIKLDYLLHALSLLDLILKGLIYITRTLLFGVMHSKDMASNMVPLLEWMWKISLIGIQRRWWTRLNLKIRRGSRYQGWVSQLQRYERFYFSSIKIVYWVLIK